MEEVGRAVSIGAGICAPSLFEVGPGADDVVQSLARRQSVDDITLSHQQVVRS